MNAATRVSVYTAFALVAVMAASCGVSTTETDSGVDPGFGAQDASGDVNIVQGSCEASYGVLTCKLDITNSSNGTSDYYIEATIYDADGANIGYGNATAQRVAGNGTAHAELTGTFTGKWHSVNLTEVQRTAS